MNFPCTWDSFLECFYKDVEEPILLQPNDDNISILKTIWYMMVICCTDCEEKLPDDFDTYAEAVFRAYGDIDYFQSIYEDCVDIFYTEKCQWDLLKLYDFVHNKKTDNKSTTVTLKIGKKRIVLENKDNWFEKIVLAEHLKKYLWYIKSPEEAKKAFRTRSSGTPLPKPHHNCFISCTYQMVSHHMQTEKVSHSFCQQMINFWEKMQYPKKYIIDAKSDPDYVRKVISKFKKNPDRYKLNMGIITEVSMSDFEMSGRSLYSPQMWPQ